MRIEWRDSAERYLEQWCTMDRRFVSLFSSPSITCEMLRDLCSPRNYQVARTIPGYGVEKYQAFAAMLNSHSGTVMTRANVVHVIEQELSNMKRVYGRSFLSAITKAFWMIKKHPVVIYDSYAWTSLQRRGLNPGYEGYRGYFAAWFRFYDNTDTQRGLNEALKSLPESSTAKMLLRTGQTTPSELKSIIEEEWFRNRVTDIRLWHEAA